MRISVRPAKRDGMSKRIFESELTSEDLDGENGKEVIISVTAGPIYRKARYEDRSQYRYDIVLSAKEVAAIAGAVNCPATRQEQ
ncbi:hypothetical protein BG36_19660 [Aquamicrobium defluvii]|uniref:Uncharacterized protein n=2 Tax=Aquamicrobium defluvii TaxID=69279 RepID=A0A011TBW8_9HYPH|nr:hypothetical protein BG36_19660 [Aquamicrobium defluvii]EZQ12622.1 hypothetical protein CF98_35240 [Halopseudomonas bauzanensis]TDR29076.1 hypothetical protein DES43_15011 [Aquamicrobium defluvii]